jgi:glycerol-3-phosphate dehydrogenase
VGSASREHTIQRGPKGVVHVTGGKLTTYREMASQVVDQVAVAGAPAARTSIEALPGGDRALEDVREAAHEVIDDVAVRDRLVTAYGSRWVDVWALGANRPQLLERLDPSHAVIGAEFMFGVEREMAMTLGDLLIRRTHLAFEAADQARSMAPAVAGLVALSLGWDHAARERALRDYDAELAGTFSLSD